MVPDCRTWPSVALAGMLATPAAIDTLPKFWGTVDPPHRVRIVAELPKSSDREDIGGTGAAGVAVQTLTQSYCAVVGSWFGPPTPDGRAGEIVLSRIMNICGADTNPGGSGRVPTRTPS